MLRVSSLSPPTFEQVFLQVYDPLLDQPLRHIRLRQNSHVSLGVLWQRSHIYCNTMYRYVNSHAHMLAENSSEF